jgi:hypothetical protein
MAAAQGERIAGGFILITGTDGTPWAVRQQSVALIHDADECRDETLLQLHGGHMSGCLAHSKRCLRGSADRNEGLGSSWKTYANVSATNFWWWR